MSSRAECSFDGCGRPYKCKGLCDSHYAQQKKGRILRPLGPPRPERSLCTYPDCGKPHWSNGLCSSHDKQSRVRQDGTLTPLGSGRAHPVRITDRQCQWCFGVFTPTGTNQKTCAGPCRAKPITARKYGLTLEDLRLLGDACMLCGSVDYPQIDHDHACCPPGRSCGGCVRGVLCNKHNRGLGFFNDSPEALRKAAAYLERS